MESCPRFFLFVITLNANTLIYNIGNTNNQTKLPDIHAREDSEKDVGLGGRLLTAVMLTRQNYYDNINIWSVLQDGQQRNPVYPIVLRQ